MQKPDKIFLENPNLLYALATNEVKITTPIGKKLPIWTVGFLY